MADLVSEGELGDEGHHALVVVDDGDDARVQTLLDLLVPLRVRLKLLTYPPRRSWKKDRTQSSILKYKISLLKIWLNCQISSIKSHS